jgi:FixJ family two-component response regulator
VTKLRSATDRQKSWETVLIEASKLIVYVVDDERGMRTMISRMLGEDAGYAPHPFADASDFLAALDGLEPGCILLDLRMPVMDGLTALEELAARGVDWPVIVLTGEGDIASAVQAMKLGAVDFLEKPVRQQTLLAALTTGARLLDERLSESQRRGRARRLVDQLSVREHEVLTGLMAGQSNKELAQSLGIGLRTVEMHRGNMMGRLGASSVAQVVALAIEAGVRPPAG